MLIKDFNQTLDDWIKELDKYDFSQLLVKPSLTNWSLGQLYMHLIDATHYFIKQVEICSSSNDNSNEEKFPVANPIFRNKDLPDALLEGPPSNALTRQPENKNQLVTDLTRLKDEINKADVLVAKSQFKGKTKHFGLGYFTAGEWLQFAEMHFRHHLRQKKRLDDFLKENSKNV